MFGDTGIITFGPFIYIEENERDVDFTFDKKSMALILEEPKWVKISIMN